MFSASRRRVRFGLLAAGAVVAVLSAVLAAAALARPVSLAGGRSARAAAVSPSALRRCATFTVNKVVDGKLVRRNGTMVKVKHVQCVTVPATACMVAWAKKRHHGRVVIKQHNPVYIAKVMCPPSVTPPTPPTTPSPPQTPAGLGNAAVAVYDVTAQGETYRPLDTLFPSQQFTAIESFTEHGYLVRLLTPFPGKGGQVAQDEIGLWLGTLTTYLPTAGLSSSPPTR